MKLRVTWIFLGILVLVALMVPAFAAAVDKAEEVEGAETEAVDTVIEPEESEVTEPEVEDSKTVEGVLEEMEEIVEIPVSTSPFYLDGIQLTELVYQNINGTNYVTVESFLTSVNPEAMVEEEGGTVTASAAVVTEIVDVSTDDTNGEMANIEEETLNFRAEVGDCYVVANGRYLYVETLVQTVEGKAAVPVRTLAEVFNLDVAYDAETQHILLMKQEGSDAFLLEGENYYDENILYWLSRIIYSESGNQSMEGQLAVGNVVMNRLNSPMFPNTIKGVLFQKNQFSPAMSGSIYRKPGEMSVVAAKLVMDGAVVLENALFFNRAGMNTFAARNRTHVATIGAHAFYS